MAFVPNLDEEVVDIIKVKVRLNKHSSSSKEAFSHKLCNSYL